MDVLPLNRTLEQELFTLTRGASLECLACGEFVMWSGGGIVCPECGSRFEEAAETRVQLGLQAG